MKNTKTKTDLVVAQNLHKYYGKGETEVRALDGVDIQIPHGEFTVFIGPSGCGKTTLMNVLGTIDEPTSGEVSIAGTDILKLNDNQAAYFRTKHIGFIFQSYNLIPVMNAFDNVAYPLLLARTPRNQVKESVEKILAAVGIGNLAKKKPAQLSGGQQQRVAIARALVNKPNLIIADEPTANLDSKTSLMILELMRSLTDQYRTTFIFSTHHELVMDYADRIYRMQDGKIIGQEERS